ncbi:MAG: methylmalonyl Co-A mutase-associated GTPase MeaB [Acidobacteria bacterium]|nr:methylmalonyl Co-A mutase-associated GTPase MeaB [Acidobacteriota bacterium]
MTDRSPHALAGALLAGDVGAIARAISLLEDGSPGAHEILKAAHAKSGRAQLVGVTGAPGAGKSTLVDALAAAYRKAGRRVGIIAVDPTSAFSGGAVLGDRIRMQRHSADPDVFIRSMATRGHFGGLARATSDAADVLDAAGYDVVLIETVGVGQDEVEIVRAADCVLVVLVPGLGDDVQAIKAGLLEIADVYVLNKADREGVDRLESEISMMLSLAADGAKRRPPIVRTVATEGTGVEPLVGAIQSAREAAESSGTAAERRRERSRFRLVELVRERILSWAVADAAGAGALDAAAEAVYRREIDPYEAADRILGAFAARRGKGAP